MINFMVTHIHLLLLFVSLHLAAGSNWPAATATRKTNNEGPHQLLL